MSKTRNERVFIEVRLSIRESQRDVNVERTIPVVKKQHYPNVPILCFAFQP